MIDKYFVSIGKLHFGNHGYRKQRSAEEKKEKGELKRVRELTFSPFF